MSITRNQKRAIAALIACRNVEDAAEQTGLNRRTIARWLAEDASFQTALSQAEGLAIDAATRQLVSLADEAIGTLRGLIKSEEATDSIRLRAAQSVLDYLLRLREARDTEQRLARLEELYGQR
jgi:hypothetical protein